MSMKLTSTAFAEGAPIPKQHTGEGADVSPPLEWTGAPAATKGFALICDDPDAPMGTWVHWVIYNIPAGAHGLPEHVPANEALPDGSRQGQNDFRVTGYRGPMPPHGKAHRYYFKLYALDFTMELPKKATKADLEKAMKGHVLAEGSLMGTYQR
ncbi:MAG: YbhB/YbcL family Raf kinase inhibitor-like protein [Candidatus Hydrogenedentes bacterium]|nr:YbhB/YbcL family Raf kinase inhibitor-like protein [Candidatus Hydrogenedentota bacterium]